MSNPFGALGSDSDSSSGSDSGSDGEDRSAPPHSELPPSPQPEPEPKPARRVQRDSQTREELEDEMELRFASDEESEMGNLTAASTSKKQLKKLRKEQRRAARHAQSRPAEELEEDAEREASAAALDSDDTGANAGRLSKSGYRSRHRVQFYSLGQREAHTPQFEPVQTFEELSGQQMPGGFTIEAVLVDACVSTISGRDSRRGDRTVYRPSPVQAECWGALLSGSAGDLVATSYTGSGKTLAFLLPMFAGGSLQAASLGEESQVVVARPQGLVLAPTRELCQQISEVADGLCAYLEQQGSQQGAATRVFCVVGGVDYATQREQILSTRPTLVAATPGRLVALCGCVPASTRARQIAAATAAGAPPPDMQDEERQPAADSIVSLESVRTLVLDEADRMLDLGFAEDIATVARLIATRDGEAHPFLSSAAHPSTWMFSATWPKAAEALATQLLLPGAAHIVIGTQKDAGGPDVDSSGQKLVTAATVQQRFERIQGTGF
jgi:hypothetical protein